MLFLVVLGGAAVLEVHRALQHSGNKDLQAARQKESELRRQLQDVQRELQQTRSQRELTEREAAALAEVNARLATDNAHLSRESSSLRAANEDLSRHAEGLAERQQQLEAAADSLQQENANLLAQFDRLKIKYEEESAGFREQLEELKQQVSGVLQRFAAGELSADALLAFLAGMGVEVRCAAEDLSGLPDQLNSARSAEERLQILDKVELSVDDSWVHQLRLSACPERAARLLMASRDAPLAAREPAASSAAALTYPQQPKKINTPNKDHGPGPKVPLLKLGSAAAPAAPAPVGAATTAAPALTAAAPAASQGVKENQPQQQAAAQPAPAAAAPAAVLKPVQENKSRSLLFLPTKKASKSRATLTTPRLEMDVVPGGGSSGGVALPRLSLGSSPRKSGGAGDEDLLGGSSRTLLSR